MKSCLWELIQVLIVIKSLTAIPSLHLNGTNPQPDETSSAEWKTRARARTRKYLISELLNDYKNDVAKSTKAAVVPENKIKEQGLDIYVEYNLLKEKYFTLEASNKEQALKIDKLNKELKEISEKYFEEQVKCANLEQMLSLR